MKKYILISLLLICTALLRDTHMDQTLPYSIVKEKKLLAEKFTVRAGVIKAW